MALTTIQRYYLTTAISNKKIADEIADQIDAGSNSQAADVADITIPALTGVDGTGSNAAPLAGVNTQLAAVQDKINAILASLKAAGIMA